MMNKITSLLFAILSLVALPTTGLCAEQAAPLASVAWKNPQWIGAAEDSRAPEFAARAPQTKKNQNPVQPRSFPSPLLRKAFTVGKPVRSAQVSVCGLGLYELYLNGKKVGDRVLDPAQTTYNKRAFYVTHDVTGLLRQGGNALGLMLGNGFYGQNIALGGRLAYGEPRATLLLSIEYADGTKETVVSDNSWKAAQGPVLFDNIYAGETYDVRRDLAGWSSPGFDDSAWKPVRKMDAPTANLVEQQLEPMRKIRPVKPVAVLPAENGEWILDMGQNMTGWLQIRVHEESGRQIRMRFAELLMPGGKAIDTASTGVFATGCEQTDLYICKGGGVETWEPRFTYHGFRYVQISGLSKKPDLNDFTGWLVRTDVQRIGTFECSDALINKFYNVSMWTIEDNLQGILTDCPHRERCAWMGDGEAVGEAASYNFDLARFWPKVSADIATVLGANPPRKGGGLSADPRAPCNISVGKRLGGQARPDWGAATVLVPWFDWLYYGDLNNVKTAWPMMQGWMAFLEQTAVKEGIITGGYGDWCPPGQRDPIDVPVALTSTALYYQSLEAMRTMAAALGKPADADHYAAQATAVKQAFIGRFYRPNEHDFGSQTGTALALHVGLAPTGEETKVAAGLVALIMQKAGGHYTTGIFGHRPLYTVLNDYGHADVTRHLLSLTDYPSLGFLTEKHGMTTWPERYIDFPPGERYPERSYNHPMQSGFAAVFHESLGGIRPDPAGPGFKHFFLKPCFLPGLEWAKAEHRSPCGLISSHWKREANSMVWEVTVPPGSTARVQLPQFPAGKIQLGGKPVQSNEFELRPGDWSIRIGS
jgi:alpha-L-rhamnosidase